MPRVTIHLRTRTSPVPVQDPDGVGTAGLVMVVRHVIGLLPLLVFLGTCVLIHRQFGWLGLVLIAVLISATIQLPLSLWKGVIVPLVWGVRCPTCREWSLVRVASISFGDRFYRCASCGQRCKRTDHDSPWLDASGQIDDDMYKPIPYHGPHRKREATRNGLRILGVMLGWVALVLAAAAVGGLVGRVILGVGVGLFCLMMVRRGPAKGNLPIRPMLWDTEADG